MSWWPWSEKAGEAAVSRSSMRDAMNRLRSIILRSGLEPEEDGTEMQSSTGDPFQDKVNFFIRQVKALKDQIIERNKNQRESMGTAADLAMDSHEINKRLSEMRKDLEQLKEMRDKAEQKLRKANVKEKEQAYIDSLEAAYKQKDNAYQNCVQAFDALKELDSQRHMSEKEADKQGSLSGSALPKGMRTSIDKIKARKKSNHINVGVNEGDKDAGDLAKNDETKEEYALIKKKQEDQDRMLGILGNLLGEITDGAKRIGAELDKQNKMLEAQSSTVDNLTGKLDTLNKGLTKLLKDQKPGNMMMYCIACLIILAMVGFFLVQFGLV